MQEKQERKNRNMSKRLNNFEALRILAMFMVIVLHYLGKGKLLTPETEAFTAVSYAAWLIEGFAIVAVNVYVLITGYFMCKSSFKLSRLIEILCQVMWYALLIPVVLALLGLADIKGFQTYDILRFVFPIHMKHYWFVTAYVVLMLLVPFLNAGIAAMSQKQLAFSILLLTVYQTLPKSVLPVVFTEDDAGYGVLWLVCLYLIAAYIRLYGIAFFSSVKKSLFCYAGAVLCIFASLLVMRVIYFRFDAFGDKISFAYDYNHIFCLLASVSLFYACKLWDIKDTAMSRLAGRIAPYTFGVYLLHEHILVRDRWQVWLGVTKTEQLAGFLIQLVWKTLLVLAAGLFLDWIRAGVFKAVRRRIWKR